MHDLNILLWLDGISTEDDNNNREVIITVMLLYERYRKDMKAGQKSKKKSSSSLNIEVSPEPMANHTLVRTRVPPQKSAAAVVRKGTLVIAISTVE